MPYVNIKITREGGPEGKGPSAQQKAELIVMKWRLRTGESGDCRCQNIGRK